MHRLGILVTGPNCSGKTTAVSNALRGFDGNVRAVYADNRDRKLFEPDFSLLQSLWHQPETVLVVEGTSRVANALGRVLEIHGDAAPFNDGGPRETTALLSKVWDGPHQVVVAEGTDRFARALGAAAASGGRQLEVLVTIQQPDAMRHHLQARCAARGKVFNAPYWDESRLVYEGHKRYVNMAARLFPQAVFFPIGPNYEGLSGLEERIQMLARKALDA